ncbi:hypothetical protein BDW22DRAFT_806617 [Trametopsis cervina]|nr:hypothetical protein BDW22DRAFT_806617 [Trametopsis cervina]
MTSSNSELSDMHQEDDSLISTMTRSDSGLPDMQGDDSLASANNSKLPNTPHQKDDNLTLTPQNSEHPDLETLRYIIKSPIAFWDRDSFFKDYDMAQNKMNSFFPLDTAPLSTRELLSSPEKFIIPAPPKKPARWIFGCRIPIDFIPAYWDEEDGLKHLRDAGVDFDPFAAIGHMRYRTGIRTLQFVERKGGVLSEKKFKRKYLLIVQDTKSAASEPNLTVPQMEEFVKLSGRPLTALKWYWARPPKQ